MRLKIFICLVLAGVTLGIYWPARHFDFIYYDDLLFLTEPALAAGLSGAGLKWVLAGVVAGNWHPVTNLTFLLMHRFWGDNPGAEHLLNALIHAANAVLLFLVLVKLTDALTSPLPSPLPLDGSGEGTAREGFTSFFKANLLPSSQRNIWLCATVAGIFAWHPLRVESVAWIAERKDVLFIFFMLLTFLCYAGYAEGGGRNGESKGRKMYYGLALFFFALSLMSKAMSVTLPFLLLLLDYWPLGRFNQGSTESRPTIKLIIEKIPFFALAVFFSLLTFHIQKTHYAISTLEYLGLGGRLENATLSYVNYLGKFFWPSKLALLYPYPSSFDGVEVLLGVLLLLAISALCLLQLSRRPYLAVGWFWYLGTMVPVIGLVQVGIAGMADRYTYLPLIGPAISVVWLV